MRWLYVVIGAEVGFIAWQEQSSTALLCVLLMAYPLLYVGFRLASSGREVLAAAVTSAELLVWVLLVPGFIPLQHGGCATHAFLVAYEVLGVFVSVLVVLGTALVRRWIAWVWRPAGLRPHGPR